LLFYNKILYFRFLLNAKKPQYGFLFIAAVAAGIDPDRGEFTPLSPALDRKRRDSKYFGDLADC